MRRHGLPTTESAAGGEQTKDDDREEGESVGVQRGELYPQHEHEYIAQLPGEADEFDLRREALLVGYGYNTARAYWGDLEHWRDWCETQEPSVDVLLGALRDVERYLQELDSAAYSPNTCARRLTVLRAFYGTEELCDAIRVRRRRGSV